MMSRVFERIMELIGWLQIVASPVFLALFISGIIYLPNPNTTTLVVCISILLIALVFGIWWATKIYRTKGTMWFMSRIMATPEIDSENKKTTDQHE